jgi:Archaeal/vacuolar-type H+-ATPase subunit C
VLPESELADEAERRLRPWALQALRSVAGPFSDESIFFSTLTRDAECSYIKLLLSAIAEGAGSAPDPGGLDLGFDLAGYPDLEKLFSGRRYRWIGELAQKLSLQEKSPQQRGSQAAIGLGDLPFVKNEIDRRYYLELWRALDSVPALLEGSLRSLVRLDAELQNVTWALRLKRYYGFDRLQIEPLLIDLPHCDVKGAALDGAARRLESRADWTGWKWARILPEELTVRGIESAARRYHCHCLYHRLHLESDTFVPLYAYYRIKELECRAIHGIIEGMKLGANGAEIGVYATETTGGAA